MRPFTHVMAIFCLAVGIAPLFAHASSTSTSGQLRLFARPEDYGKLAQHFEDLSFKLADLERDGLKSGSRDHHAAVDEYLAAANPLMQPQVALNQQHSAPEGHRHQEDRHIKNP
ncbi:hypothetical protein F5148DRAFT_1369918 [Russula earlei]|uniref:Uncharacterized protein n=1 Tax=Russula earlei TaxID=71964 RepID=A0ACC0U0Z5_9AGAM|nr:hypothetical protein F5148DRAFT_1369918 [Russula earlei]